MKDIEEERVETHIAGPVHRSHYSILTPSIIHKYFLLHCLQTTQRISISRDRK